MALIKTNIHELELNPFDSFGADWALLTAGNETEFNTMTISWGGLGVLWNKNVATVYVRPQRYTKQFVDKFERFSISFFDEDARDALRLLGRKSGRDGDKVAESGLTSLPLEHTMSFEEARLVLVCRKLYMDSIKPEGFIDKACDTDNYPGKDHHVVYIAEVEHIYMSSQA